MKRIVGLFSNSVTMVVLLIALSPIVVFSQTQYPVIYEFGPTMVDLMLQQQSYEGSSPMELEGMRQGIEQQLAETPISITIKNEGTLIFLVNGNGQELPYQKKGLKLLAKNLQTGEYVELGFFSKDGSTLTFMKSYILDRVK